MKLSSLLSFFVVFFIISRPALSQVDSSKLAGEHIIFAVGYGTPKKLINNYVLIGDYFFKEKSFIAKYKKFDANANLKPKKAASYHNLEAPYGKHACEDKIIDIPSESAEMLDKGTWEMDGKILKLTINARTYEWQAEDDDDNGYKLLSIRDDALNEDLPLAVGFAYLTKKQNVPAKLNKKNFFPYYKGDIYHKNNNAVANSPWEFKSSGLKISAFSESDNGDVLNYSSPGNVVTKGAWVGNGILLNYGKTPNNIVYEDIGHDLNKNGCYDEFGHNKIIAVAYNDTSTIIRNMVYIEYSYTFDGFPMISVGRYFH